MGCACGGAKELLGGLPPPTPPRILGGLHSPRSAAAPQTPRGGFGRRQPPNRGVWGGLGGGRPPEWGGGAWGAAGRPLKDRRDVNFLTRPFSRAASHGAGPAPRACPALLRPIKTKSVDLSFHLLLFLLWGAAASQTPRLILGGSPNPPAGGEQNNTKHICD